MCCYTISIVQKTWILIIGNTQCLTSFGENYNGTKVDTTEALCILLRRLAYTCRFLDITPTFARSVSELSIIFDQTSEFLYEQLCCLLQNFNQAWLSSQNLQLFANAIHAQGALALADFSIHTFMDDPYV